MALKGSRVTRWGLPCGFHVSHAHLHTWPSPPSLSPTSANDPHGAKPQNRYWRPNLAFPAAFSLVSSTSVAIFAPVDTFHTAGPRPSLTVSEDVDNSVVPSGENATPLTASACDPSNRVPEGSSVGHANNRTSPLSRPTARDAPSGENAAHLTSHVASVTRVAAPDDSSRSRGEIRYGADASGGGASDSSVSASCVDASLAVTTYTATSPEKATRSSAP
mmetsp:Transcript_1187/g.4442  ORF Transcript_1187/g.4442 Transcript_1187/m.4442 type:complete len:219 (+) Transcript_1187:390-1046(+)